MAASTLEGWPANVTTFLVDQNFTMDETNTVVEAVLSADTHGKSIQDEINRLEEADDGREYTVHTDVEL